MGRKPLEEDYGLPPLTFAEAARLLGVDEGAFMNWVMKTARPSVGRWGEWEKGQRPLPERLIRLYLAQQPRLVDVYLQELREIRLAVTASQPPPPLALPAAPAPAADEGTGRTRKGRASGQR